MSHMAPSAAPGVGASGVAHHAVAPAAVDTAGATPAVPAKNDLQIFADIFKNNKEFIGNLKSVVLDFAQKDFDKFLTLLHDQTASIACGQIPMDNKKTFCDNILRAWLTFLDYGCIDPKANTGTEKKKKVNALLLNSLNQKLLSSKIDITFLNYIDAAYLTRGRTLADYFVAASECFKAARPKRKRGTGARGFKQPTRAKRITEPADDSSSSDSDSDLVSKTVKLDASRPPGMLARIAAGKAPKAPPLYLLKYEESRILETYIMTLALDQTKPKFELFLQICKSHGIVMDGKDEVDLDTSNLPLWSELWAHFENDARAAPIPVIC